MTRMVIIRMTVLIHVKIPSVEMELSRPQGQMWNNVMMETPIPMMTVHTSALLLDAVMGKFGIS